MVCQPLRLALLIGAITAVAVSPARANFRAPRCCDPCGSSSSATAPVFRSAHCTEWVKETHAVKRTAYKVECRTETYDTFRTECVPVCKERTVTVKNRVPVWTEETRKVCHKVTVWEDRTVNKTSHKYVQETCMKKQLVRLGHWESRETQPIFGGSGLFSGHGHGKACADPCKSSDACRPTRTHKVWVPCPEYKECPVTVCKKVCVTEAVKCKVAVCKTEMREEKVKVCTYKCVEEKRVVKCTEYETRKVACKATRTVRVCVPYETTVNCCKWVQRPVAAPATSAACGKSTACCERQGLLSRLRDRTACSTHSRSRDCCRPSRDCCRPTCASSCK